MSEQSTALRVIKPQYLTKVGSRLISTVGFRVDLVLQHLEWHRLLENPRQRWCTVDCMAKTIYHRKDESNRKRIRERMAKVVRDSLDRYQRLVVLEYADRSKHGKIQAMKIYDGGDGLERQCAMFQIDRMRKKRFLTDRMLETAMHLMEQAQPASAVVVSPESTE